jgi:predicted metalloprotease with PDZ domain
VGLKVGIVDATLTHRGFDAVQKFDQPAAVVRVEPGSAAERAGLKPGDILLSINGTAAGRKFEQKIEALGPGATLQLRVRRDGVPYDLQWKLEAQKMKIYHVEDLPSISPEQRAQRKAWLFGDAGASPQ